MSAVKPLRDSAAGTAAATRHGAFGGQGDAAQRQEAWQREMERAQMSAWFKPSPTAAHGNTTTPSDREGVAPARAGMREAAGVSRVKAIPAAPAASSSLDMRRSLPAPSSQAGRAGLAGSTAQLPQTASHPIQLRQAIVGSSQDERLPTDVQPRMRAGVLAPPAVDESGAESASAHESQGAEDSASSPMEDQSPLRLHEESLPEGQAVWIAMRADDDALTAMLPRIVADLQRAMTLEHGKRLYQVVCNGRLIWRDGADAAASISSSTGNSSSSGVDRRPTVFDTFQSKGA